MARDATTGTPPMIGRRLTVQEWLDYVAGYDFGSLPPDRIVLHHTWSPTQAQWKGLASMQGMQNYYRGKGWASAPHIYVAEDGIWLFTPMYDVGIHANTGNANLEFQKTWNVKDLKWYSIGLEMVGDFDKQKPAGKTWEHALAVMGALCKRLNIPVEKISLHRDYSDKSCPGWSVTHDWVRAEVANWLTPRKLERFVTTRGTNIHQGPGAHFPVAGSFAANTPFEGILKDDDDCFEFEGQRAWVWVGTGIGFVPVSRTDRSAAPQGLTIVAEPRISRVQFTRVLASSPALPWTCDLYDICVREGVDPAVALAFFYHESKLGTLGLTKDYDLKNWGNVRTPEDANLGQAVNIPGRGNFTKYPSWTNGLLDWCKRLKGPKYAGSGLTTVETVVPKYAPSSDGNAPTSYIAAVLSAVERWKREDS